MLTAGNDLKEILQEELGSVYLTSCTDGVGYNNNSMFRDRALDHRDALDEEESDALRRKVSTFMK
jgi:hypothetical protein